MKAAFTKDGDLFAEMGVTLHERLRRHGRPARCSSSRCSTIGRSCSACRRRAPRAVDEGYAAGATTRPTCARPRARCSTRSRATTGSASCCSGARTTTTRASNHGILDEFQQIGYPVFSQSTLPIDEDLLERLFGDEVRAGRIQDPLRHHRRLEELDSENTNRKIWAAKFVARHPNLVAVELSYFKCGHDAPIYTIVEEIVETSGTPYFCFKDIDENKPVGSIKIRLETIDYFLKRYREDLVTERGSRQQIELRLAELEAQLRAELAGASAGGGQ